MYLYVHVICHCYIEFMLKITGYLINYMSTIDLE